MRSATSPVWRILDRLYRLRWWTTAVAVTLLVFVVPDRAALHPVAWVLFGLLLFLVWIPVGVRWTRRVRQAGLTFPDGLAGR